MAITGNPDVSNGQDHLQTQPLMANHGMSNRCDGIFKNQSMHNESSGLPFGQKVYTEVDGIEHREPYPANMVVNFENSVLGDSKNEMRRKEDVPVTSSNRAIHT